MKKPQYVADDPKHPQWQGQLINGLDYVISRHGKNIFVDVFNSCEEDASNAHILSETMDSMGGALRYLKDLELQPANS